MSLPHTEGRNMPGITGQKIVVTGGNGWPGSAAAKAALDRLAKVTIRSRHASASPGGAAVVQGSITDPEAVPTAHGISEREQERGYEVTPLELFFDLVFVFALSQLSRHLLAHLSWRGAAETLVLLLAVLTVWTYTSWAATMIPVVRSSTRRMVLAVMLLGLFMNAALARAFTTSGPWAFVVPLLLIHLGRTAWTIASATDAVYREHYVRVLIWFLATTPLWIAGAAANAEARVLWWALAAGIELTGTWLAHPIPGRRLHSENVAFDADHLLERCRLFLLIALGETVLATGTAIAQASLTMMTLVTGTFALLGTVALWSLSFGRSNTLIVRHLEETRDPIRASRFAINALMVMVAGLIAVAVANEMVIAHPLGHDGHASAALSLLLYGGPFLFLAAQGWYLWVVPRASPRSQIAGCAALVLFGLVTVTAPPFVALVLAGVSLTTLALLDQQ
jgi:low temperature requirement protein LtrA